MKNQYFLIVLLTANIFAQGIVPDSLPIWRGYENAATAPEQKNTATKKEGQLQTTGSKSLQTSIGSGGADVQQELRLSVNGEATDGVFIDAYLVDLGRPAGTEITTTLREVDAAYIGIESKRAKLELGDLNYEINRNALWELNRKTLGIGGKLKGNSIEASTIYGTDKTERQSIVFSGQPSQQRGYLLFSDSTFGIIAPHTERVYLNGTLLRAGQDYEINYAGGVLDFLGQIIPGPEDEIRVEYDSYSLLNSSELRAAEAAYRSKFVWLDLAAFNLRDSLKNDKMLGARLRSGNSFLFADMEIAMNENDNKAYRWFFESDSNSRQKSTFKIAVKGGFADSGFTKADYIGSDNAWDNFILRDKWLLDSIPNGSLRYDELRATVRLPFGFYPGFFAGHRNFESFRGEGFLRRETEFAESNLSLANINSEQDTASNSLWQGEIQSKFLQGAYRPYGNFRMDSRENLRSIYGLEHGDKNLSYASSEITKEKIDSSAFWNWKTFISLKDKDWYSNSLFQIRSDEQQTKRGLSWLLDQNMGYHNTNSALRGDVLYAFNYTNEVPWIAIYRRVPNGAGDVYYDSLSGQYISGVDNGDFVYEGMGRADSLAKRQHKSDLKWNVSMHPNIILNMLSAPKGVLNDIVFLTSGEWLLHSSEKLLLLENSSLWEHPQNKGSFMFTISSKHNKEPQILFEEELFGLSAVAHYKGREKEDFSLRAKRESADFPVSGLNWLSWQGEFAWQRELGLGFSLQPFYLQKYTDGFYSQKPWNAALHQSGINGKWQNERGSLAQLGVSGNYVEKSSTVSPYSAVDGFEEGFSWRANAVGQMSFGNNFYISAQYIIRMQNGNALQKLSSDARAVF
ncbi:MAG: hypothetical protein LBH25_11415 [Fibromonadaceae bacterium]|nr:hypothetical protein [Fibromonadaceae bacterium]